MSPPHLQDHTALSTSSSIDDVVAEFPMFVFILTAKFLPIIIGSLSGWLMLAGSTARPAAISERTNSGVMCVLMPNSSQFIFSRMATYSISGVMMPALAYAICVICLPLTARRGMRMCSKRRWSSEWSESLSLPYSDVSCSSTSVSPRFSTHSSLMRGSPFFRSILTSGSENGPLVS